MIIFLYGENTFLAKRKLKEFKNKFLNDIDPGGNNIFYLVGDTLSVDKLNEKIGSRSLLVKKRMIIIENIFQNKTKTIFKEITEYLKLKEKSLEDNIIIFIDSGVKSKAARGKIKKQTLMIDKSGKEKVMLKNPSLLFNFLSSQQFTQEFPALSNTEVSNWVKKEIENKKGSITFQASQLLSSLLGNNLWQINNEIDKLINYKLGSTPKLLEGGGKIEIDIKDVETLVKGSFDENIFALTDAISNKNIKLASKYLEEQYEAGLSDSYLINMFVRQFKILIQIRQALDSGLNSRKIMSELKLHPFIIQKGINQVRNFNLENLKNILNKLIKIDYSMKTGKGDPGTMLRLLILNI